MKKIYRKIILASLTSLTVLFVNAVPLNGTYTIGGTTPDYISFNAAAGALFLNGVSGPVIFNVRDGVYDELVAIGPYSGVNAVNTITFQSESGDSSAVSLQDTSLTTSTNNFTLGFIGAHHIIFKQMTIRRSGSNTYSTVIELSGTANNISIQNCIIAASSGTLTSADRCCIYSPNTIENNNSFLNNRILGNSYGIYLTGNSTTSLETGNIAAGNIFTGQYAAAIFMANESGIIISGNEISQPSGNLIYGIQFTACVANSKIIYNKIYSSQSQYGISLNNCIAAQGNGNIISDNFISIGGPNLTGGIYLNGCAFVNIYFNSVNDFSTLASSAALRIIGVTSDSINVLNNIFVNTGNGYAYSADANGILAINTSDFNDLYSTAASLGLWGTSTALTLTDWQTFSSKDGNSVSADPIFISSSDLHVSAASVNNLATPIATDTVDIDGEPRDAVAPDIGADEFSPLNDNVALIDIISPQSGACADSNTIITVIIRNFGLNAQSNIPVNVDITGTSSQSFSGIYAGPLATNSTDTFTITTAWNNYNGGIFDLKCYTSLTGDQYLLNDTAGMNAIINAIPNPPTAVSPQLFCANDVNVTASHDSGDVILWYDAQTGGNLLYTGDTFHLSLLNDTVFFAESRMGSGSSGCIRITQCEVEDNPSDFFEIQNLGSVPVNATGWIAAVSNSYTDINLVNSTLWNLPATINPGEVIYRTDNTTDNYWGSNLFWNSVSNSWAIILDNAGNIVDFVAWGWTDADIQSMNTTIGGFNVTIGSQWTGAGPPNCGATVGTSVTRQGVSDHDDASDWICDVSSKGVQNSGLTVPFTACGMGACGSTRIPVQVNLLPLPVVNLGTDITSPVPVQLDAGPGMTSYLWSDSSTAQTLNVNVSGTYWVIVTDANGCSNSDTIIVTLTIGIEELGISSLNIYPNPVRDHLNISFNNLNGAKIEIVLKNSLGQVMHAETISQKGLIKKVFDMRAYSKEIYLLEISSSYGKLIRKVSLL